MHRHCGTPPINPIRQLPISRLDTYHQICEMSSFTIYLAVFTYLADCYGPFASSALAGQSLSRNIFGMAFPLFTNQMFDKLTYHWANSLFGFLALALAPVPFVRDGCFFPIECMDSTQARLVHIDFVLQGPGTAREKQVCQRGQALSTPISPNLSYKPSVALYYRILSARGRTQGTSRKTDDTKFTEARS